MSVVADVLRAASAAADAVATAQIARRHRKVAFRVPALRLALVTAVVTVLAVDALLQPDRSLPARIVTACAVAALLPVAALMPKRLELGLAGLEAANLPGAPPTRGRAPRVGAGWANVALVATAWLVVVIVWLVPSGWAGAGVALAGLAVTATLTALVLAAVRHGREVRTALDALAPGFVLPYSGYAVFHLSLWTPYLDRTGYPSLVATFRKASFDAVADGTDLPVVFSWRRWRPAVQAMIPQTVGAAVYVRHGAINPFAPIRRVRHVFVHHGDSDKVSGARDTVRKYDDIVVPGQAAVDRYAARGVTLGSAEFRILGRPNVETIAEAVGPIGETAQPTVLYAPTWHGKDADEDYSSLVLGPRIVRALLDHGATVIFRPHPAGRKRAAHAAAIAEITAMLSADAAVTGRAHVWGEAADRPPFSELANVSDAMISDISGVIVDYIASLKPYAVVSTRVPVEEFRDANPTTQAAYVLDRELANLEEVLDHLLGDDPLAPLRRERRDYFLGGFAGPDASAPFVAYAADLVHGRRTNR